MVIQAPKEAKQPNTPRPSPVSRIGKIASLKRYNDRDYALDLLHQMARAVAPIIHQYKFLVGTLCEMFPKNPGLLGLNVNKGQKILIRLRMPHNERSFFPMSDLIGTFLHELVHNVHGPHDAKFYALLDELRTKYENGAYATEDYVCEENKLGKLYSAPWEVAKTVRQKRLEALSKGKFKAEARRLGGSSVGPSAMREAMLRAAERRLRDSKWCPLGDLDAIDLEELDLDGEVATTTPLKLKEYKEVIDLTQEEAQDPEDIEVLEVDACDKPQVDQTRLWASVLKPDKAETTPETTPEEQIQYRVSSSPKSFIGVELAYPRRKMVADLDFGQIIEKGEKRKIDREEKRTQRKKKEPKPKPGKPKKKVDGPGEESGAEKTLKTPAKGKGAKTARAKNAEDKQRKEVRAISFDELLSAS